MLGHFSLAGMHLVKHDRTFICAFAFAFGKREMKGIVR